MADGSIDVGGILAPISEEAPCGADLRANSAPIYYQLKDARNSARQFEKKADEGEGGESAGMAPEWRTILTLAPKVLTEESKDLEVAAWYIEALLRDQGFAGLREGYSIVYGLVDKYWDSFFSLEDEDGLETRLAPLTGLNGSGADGTLIQPMLKVPITGSNGDDGPFSLFHFEQAQRMLGFADPEVRARKAQQGEVTLERFTAAVSASGGAFYAALITDISGALEQFEKLTALLDERAGSQAPPSSNIRDKLVTILDTVKSSSKDLLAASGVSLDGSAAPGEGDAAAPAAGAAAGPASAGGIRTREDALRMLLQIAEHFRTTEPQSPISAILEETVRRARMSFADLLAELHPDSATWRLMLTNSGIKPPPEEG